MSNIKELSTWLKKCILIGVILESTCSILGVIYVLDRRSLKIENENNNAKTLTKEDPYTGRGYLEFRFI